MVKVYPDIVSLDQVQLLLDYMNHDDERTDSRPDVRSKNPRWDVDKFPQQQLKSILDQVLDQPYRIEAVLFNDSRISFKLHADTGVGATHEKIYKNVLIPLWFEGPASTVIFDNYWYGPNSRFGRQTVSPFFYNLIDSSGQMRPVDDIRILLLQCKNNPAAVEHFVVDDQFIKELEVLIFKRSGTFEDFRVDNFVTDYRNISNYNSNLRFDKQTHQTYLNHIPIENLHGLTIESIVPWEIGSVMTFDRSQIHCAGYGHTRKIGITFFTSFA
jgi:hypothetical protein